MKEKTCLQDTNKSCVGCPAHDHAKTLVQNVFREEVIEYIKKKFCPDGNEPVIEIAKENN